MLKLYIKNSIIKKKGAQALNFTAQRTLRANLCDQYPKSWYVFTPFSELVTELEILNIVQKKIRKSSMSVILKKIKRIRRTSRGKDDRYVKLLLKRFISLYYKGSWLGDKGFGNALSVPMLCKSGWKGELGEGQILIFTYDIMMLWSWVIWL